MIDVALILALIFTVCTVSVNRHSSYVRVEVLGFDIVKTRPGSSMFKNLNMIRNTEGKSLFVVTPWKKLKNKIG